MTPLGIKNLLQSCFLATPAEVIAQLRPLDAASRKQLYRELKPILKLIKKLCRYSDKAFIQSQQSFLGASVTNYAPRVNRVDEIWPAVATHLDSLESYCHDEDISLYAAKDAGLFYLKLQMLHVGLAPLAQIPAGFKYSRSNLPYFVPDSYSESWAYNLGLVLLERPESWNLEALLSLCSRIHELPEPRGWAWLLRVALEREPDWGGSLAPYLGQSMFLDGFHAEDLSGFSAQMLLAGLAYEPEHLAGLSAWGLPLNFAAEALMRRLRQDDIPRHELIGLLFRRLHSAPKSSHIKAWLDLYAQLQLNPAEHRDVLGQWIQLLFAPSGLAYPAAVRVLKPMLKQGELQDAFDTLLTGALHGLQQRAPGIARSGWELFKALAATRRDQSPELIAAITPALGIPHPKIRLQMLKWLQRMSLPEQVLDMLNERLAQAHQLTALEQAEIRHLLPSPPPSQSTKVSAQQKLSGPPTESETLAKELDLQAWQPANWDSYLQDPPLLPYPDADTLADAMNHAVMAGISPLELERLMAGVLQHSFTSPSLATGKKAIHTELHHRLEAVWRVLARWQSETCDEQLYRLPQRSLHVVMLAYGWLHQGSRPALHQVSAPHRDVQLGTPLGYCLLQQVDQVLRCLAGGQGCRLATPDYATGWIRPETLLQRLLSQLCLSEPGFDSEDLGLALLRLAPVGREALWPALAADLSRLQHPAQQAALQIALGPDSACQAGIQSFVQLCRHMPPDDWILQTRYYTAQPRDTEPNRNFRLLHRAVLARTGLRDARAIWPDLLDLQQDQLLINGGLDHTPWNDLTSEALKRDDSFAAIGELVRQGGSQLAINCWIETAATWDEVQEVCAVIDLAGRRNRAHNQLVEKILLFADTEDRIRLAHSLLRSHTLSWMMGPKTQES
ncbi:MAG: hypothetical protein CVV27_08375 [Candidatus Melainabacteria bacterium HGW-Melainabacteria-1]|nr:MAG: hypothetical protein CVV27_08375 [Candidatus Melainabacteria bacterium HGW-Melainabacteria-1]